MIFHDVTILAGSIRSRRTKDTASIAPEAIEIFRDLFERHGDHFRAPLPVPKLELSWTRQGSSAVATFWQGNTPLTTSALAPGIDPDDDRIVLEAVQSMIVQLFRDTPLEPGFDLGAIVERPLLATVIVPTLKPDRRMLGIVADAENCLAAAFFSMLSETP